MSPTVPVDLLKRVSRTFYLSLAVLPRDLRPPIGLAYLLARAADSIADTRLVARDERLAQLETLRAAISRPGTATVVSGLAAARQDEAERLLLTRLPECLDALAAMPADDAARVRGVLDTITDGMRFDLIRFPGDDATGVAALETLENLDHYTYLVAGCVGAFWTEMHVAHRPRLGRWDLASMCARGVRFGKALQMTNILRDAPRDLRRGRCYLPARDLARAGLRPADLLDPAASTRVQPVWRRLLRLALGHYEAAWQYTLAIPRAEVRMRLACAWPLLIGLATLALLAESPHVLDPTHRIKLSRAAVRGVIARSAVTVWSNRALAADAARLRRRIAIQDTDGRPTCVT